MASLQVADSSLMLPAQPQAVAASSMGIAVTPSLLAARTDALPARNSAASPMRRWAAASTPGRLTCTANSGPALVCQARMRAARSATGSRCHASVPNSISVWAGAGDGAAWVAASGSPHAPSRVKTSHDAARRAAREAGRRVWVIDVRNGFTAQLAESANLPELRFRPCFGEATRALSHLHHPRGRRW